MNSLYHQFNIGFNWFYVTGPLLLVLAAVAGYFSVQIEKKDGDYSIVTHFNRKSRGTEILIGIVSVLFTVEVMNEVIDGLIQFHDNSLGKYESGVWSVFAAIFELVAFGIVFFVLLCGIYGCVQRIREKYLKALYGISKVRREKSYVELEKTVLHQSWCDAIMLLSIATDRNLTYFDKGMLDTLHQDLFACQDEEEAQAYLANYIKKFRGKDEDEENQ